MIAGRYVLDREIGRGGMGAVWLARDEVLGRAVAMKRIGMAPGGSSPDLERAEREARLAARLNHPHVVAVYDLVTEGDERWLVMEHVDGATLAEIVRRDGALSPDQAATLLQQAAEALAAAHGAGIVHRDVKPSNILVSPGGQAKLSDFGIARAQADASLTQTGLVTGSPAYLAPEIASGQQASAASDVWSWGATLFHALAGHPPYEVGDNVIGALYRIVHEEPPRLGAAAGWLAPVLDATMATDPEQRWSMAQVAEFLAAGPSAAAAPVATQTLAAPPATAPAAATAVVPPAERPAPEPPIELAPEPPRAPDRGRRAWGLPLLLLAVVVVIVLVLVWLAGSGGDDPNGGTAGSDRSSSAPPKKPSKKPEPPAPSTSMTAGGMEAFVRDYLATVTSNPRQAWTRLTPSFQQQSGGYGSYEGFWSTIASAKVVSAEASPDQRSISYRVAYVREDGSRTTEDVTLQLEGSDGDLKIAGES